MKQIGTSWDRANRNIMNENFTEAERKVLEQKQRVDRLIQDAPQPSEVVDARGEHAVLGDRLNDFTAQLAQTEEKQFHAKVMQHRSVTNLTKIITILDDDTNKALYDTFYPTLKGLGVPFTAAAITDRIETGHANTITKAQYEEMRDSGYVEFISHGKTHVHLAEQTDAVLDEELRASRDWLIKNGGNPDYLVYPFNSRDDRVYKATRKYYKGAFASTRNINKPPLNSMIIERDIFDESVEYTKSKIDELDLNGGWLVLNSHSQYVNNTPEFITEIVQYAQAKGIPFMTVSEAMRYFGNIVDLENGVIGANGSRTGALQDIKYVDLATSTVDVNTPGTEFESYKMTTTHVTTALAQERNFPGHLPGFYTVDRRSNNFTRSFYEPLSTTSYYVRYWNNSTNTWGEWLYNHNALQYVDGATSSVQFDTPIDAFKPYTETTMHFTQLEAAARGFPSGIAGIYTVDRRSSSFTRSFYYPHMQDYYCYRWWNTEQNRWHIWKKVLLTIE